MCLQCVMLHVCRVAFPSAEIRCIERDGASEVLYCGLVPRMNAASLGAHSGTVATVLQCTVFVHCMFCIPSIDIEATELVL